MDKRSTTMNVIPWRKKGNIPVARETALSTPISEFRKEMDHLFRRFFGGTWMEPAIWPGEAEWPTHEFLPSIDVTESDKRITIRAEVPGMDPQNLTVNVSGNTLVIRGEKKEESEEKGEDHYHCERHFGTFTRNIELPATADLDDIEAEQRNGVLTIRVKKQPAQSKRVEVKTREMAGSKM
jgi:HSP20 family protein